MWMPRKMSGRAISMIEMSMVAIVMPSVVFDRTTHLYLSGRVAPGPASPPARPFIAPLAVGCPFIALPLRSHLLDDRSAITLSETRVEDLAGRQVGGDDQRSRIVTSWTKLPP